jgi:hypothetical protein
MSNEGSKPEHPPVDETVIDKRLAFTRRPFLAPTGGAVAAAPLRTLTQLRHLDLSETGIADDPLEHPQSLQHLRHLDSSATAVSDDGLVHLKALRQLVWLDPGKTSVTGSGLADFAGLSRLASLDQSLAPIDDEERVHLQGLRVLRHSTMRHAVGADGIARLKKLPGLVFLARGVEGFEPDDVAALAGLKTLTELTLCDIDDESLKRLPSLPKVERLVMSNPQIEGPALRALARLPSLRALAIYNDGSGGVAMAHLPRRAKLETLQLWAIQVNDGGARAFSRLPRLVTLARRLEDESAIGGLRGLRTLRTAEFSDACPTDAGARMLAGYPMLTTVMLDTCAEIDEAPQTKLPLVFSGGGIY